MESFLEVLTGTVTYTMVLDAPYFFGIGYLEEVAT